MVSVKFIPFLLFFVISVKLVNSSQLSAPDNPIYATEQEILNHLKVDIEEALTCTQLIEYHGYKAEKYHVTTEDGYILELYRIVNPASRRFYGNNLVPVLILHGILVSCGSWMYNAQLSARKGLGSAQSNAESNDLAIALADREFDVWLGNARGTSYSRNHTHLDLNDSKFWNFSWVSIGRYDIPAMVDHIRNVTKFEKIVYIGHSQATQAMMTLLSERPYFAEKLYLNILISPIGFFNEPLGLFALIPRERSFYLALGNLDGPFPPLLPQFDATLTLLCTVPLIRPICETLYKYSVGPNKAMIDSQHFPVWTSLIDTASFKCVLHELQAANFGQLRYFDYGDDENFVLYGSNLPPKINLTKIPVHNLVLVSGLNDYLAKPENVQRLRNVLKGSPLVDHVINYRQWSHDDIIFGNRAFEFAHLPIISIIRKHVIPPYRG